VQATVAQQQQQQQQQQQGPTSEASAAGGAQLPSLSCTCSCLEACLGHLAAAGLLPVLLEASCAPLLVSSQPGSTAAAGKVDPGTTRPALGRVLNLVSHVLQSHMGDPSVAAWWRAVNTAASAGDADTPGQHWLLTDLQRAAAPQVTAPTPGSRPSSATAAGGGGGSSHAATAAGNTSSSRGTGWRPLPGLVTAGQVKRAWSTLTTSSDWGPLQQLPPSDAAAVQQVLRGDGCDAVMAAAAAALRELLVNQGKDTLLQLLCCMEPQLTMWALCPAVCTDLPALLA
jgi:hypothetical protein